MKKTGTRRRVCGSCSGCRMRMARVRRMRGSAALEGLLGMIFLLFLLLALIQLFVLTARQMFVDYAAFYGSKALSLGYAGEICRKSVKVAAMGASGRDISDSDRVSVYSGSARSRYQRQAERYMQLGRASGVEYEYWEGHNDQAARIQTHFSWTGDLTGCRVRVDNAPLLLPAARTVMELSRDPEPEGTAAMYNYAKDWLDE